MIRFFFIFIFLSKPTLGQILGDKSPNPFLPMKKRNEGIYMDFLELVEEFIQMGMDEDTACREAYAELYPETYDPEDYE